jgi:hypothetical protein
LKLSTRRPSKLRVPPENGPGQPPGPFVFTFAQGMPWPRKKFSK